MSSARDPWYGTRTRSKLLRTTQITNGMSRYIYVTRHRLTYCRSMWAIYDNSVYDLTDYVYTANLDKQFNFINDDIVSLFQQQPGQDITQSLNRILGTLEPQVRDQNLNCISNLFFIGKPDFRDSARCQVQNVLLLVITIILMVSVAVKCESASKHLDCQDADVVPKSWLPFSSPRNGTPRCWTNSCCARSLATPKAKSLSGVPSTPSLR